jgi:putative oxidoreductase
MQNPQHLGIVLLRVTIALMMVIHGVTRIRLGGVTGFGGFLAENHVPLGVAVAWVLTLVEIGGGVALALGYGVIWLCAWFAIQLAMGIALVHFKEGWFVVGAGRNGMEYSVVLIAGLVSIALTHWPRYFSTAKN